MTVGLDNPGFALMIFLFYKTIGDSSSQQPSQYDEIQLTHPDDQPTDSNSSSENQTLATTLQTSFTPSSQQVDKYVRLMLLATVIWMNDHGLPLTLSWVPVRDTVVCYV